jgi:hypothetical protein
VKRTWTWTVTALAAAAAVGAPEPSGACSVADPCEDEEVLVLGDDLFLRPLGASGEVAPGLPDEIVVVYDGRGRPHTLVLGTAELRVWPQGAR